MSRSVLRWYFVYCKEQAPSKEAYDDTTVQILAESGTCVLRKCVYVYDIRYKVHGYGCLVTQHLRFQSLMNLYSEIQRRLGLSTDSCDNHLAAPKSLKTNAHPYLVDLPVDVRALGRLHPFSIRSLLDNAVLIVIYDPRVCKSPVFEM